jgi:cysteine desulfurase
LSLSAHKFHGPKGTGALFTRATVPFTPLIHGGGQESGRRSGTENVAGIVGLGTAAELAVPRTHQEGITALRNRFEAELIHLHSGVQRNGSEPRLPNTSNLFFPGIDAQALLIVLDHLGVCASPGSACGSAAKNPSPVLAAMGFDPARVRGSVRFSLSSFTTSEEIDQALSILRRALERVSAVMPPADSPVVRKGS